MTASSLARSFVASVVIPAHDEAAVIGRCLLALTADAQPGELEIVVVCNGCTDATASLAREFQGVTVLETPVASKAVALNLGDAAVRTFPRIFLDADAAMTATAAKALAAALGPVGLLAASPAPRLELAGVSGPMRRFQSVLDQTDYRRSGMAGAGVYALSKSGRARFGEFPDLIADDTFVRSLFEPDERGTVDDATVTVWPSRTVRGLVRRSVRVQAGNRQLAQSSRDATGPSLPSLPRDRRRHLRLLARVCADPSLLVNLPLFAAVTVWIRALGWWKFAHGDLRTWDRDDSSRSIVVAADA